MNYENILNEFINFRTKDKIESKHYQYNVIWNYTGLKEVTNIEEFLIYMKKAFSVEVNGLLGREIRRKIIEIRNIFNDSNIVATKIISEIDDQNFKTYEHYLSSVYLNQIEFVSNTLISYIIYNIIHKNHYIDGNEIDPEDMYDFKFNELNLKFLKMECELARKLKKSKPENEDIFISIKKSIDNYKNSLFLLKKQIFK